MLGTGRSLTGCGRQLKAVVGDGMAMANGCGRSIEWLWSCAIEWSAIEWFMNLASDLWECYRFMKLAKFSDDNVESI